MTSTSNRTIYRRPPLRVGGYYTNNMRQINKIPIENQQQNNNRFNNHDYRNVQIEKSWKRSFLNTFVAFCQQSTLHGLKNIIENFTDFKMATSRHHKITKLISVMFWAVACLLGTGFALTLMYLVWLRYDTTPTITTVETTNYPIWNVPFPAVTICNVNKVYKPATENITAILMERGIEEYKINKFLSNLDKLITPDFVDSLFYRFFEILQSLNYTSERLMLELMEPCTFMLQRCNWLGKSVPCQTLFRVAKSSEGFCCSFNYKALKTSLEVDSDEDSVSDQLDDPVYRVSGAGINVGLSALIRIAPTHYVAYSKSFYGAYVLIHGPEDYPQASVTTVVGQPGCDLAIAVTPSVVVSEPSIRKLPKSKRNCLFDDEKKLRTSVKYSYQTCITECSVDTIIDRCRCLPFFFPEINLKMFSKNIRQCTLMDARCLRENQHIFYSLKPKDDIDDGAGNKNADLGMTCDQCLPSCSEENYSVETNLARRYPEDKLMSNNLNSANLSYYLTFKIYFKDIVCIKYRRDVFQTWDGLLAGFGGIFGLCLGGSVISLVEMIYFFTIRLYSDYVGNDKVNKISTTKIVPISSNIDASNINQKMKNQMMLNVRTINQSIIKAGYPVNVNHGMRSIGYGNNTTQQYY